jgi:hypothetical protein
MAEMGNDHLSHVHTSCTIPNFRDNGIYFIDGVYAVNIVYQKRSEEASANLKISTLILSKSKNSIGRDYIPIAWATTSYYKKSTIFVYL